MGVTDLFDNEYEHGICPVPQAQVPQPTTNSQWYIKNGTWWLKDYDSKYPARGPKGEKGDTPEPNETTGTWFLGNVDTGVSYIQDQIEATENTLGSVMMSPEVEHVVGPDAVITAIPDATDEETAIDLVNDLKAKFNNAVDLINELKAVVNAKLTADESSGQQQS